MQYSIFIIYFLSGSSGEEHACLCTRHETGLISVLGRSPGGGHGNPLHYFCLKNPHGQRSLATYSPWGCKEWIWLKQLRAHKRIKQVFFFFFLYFYKSNKFVNSLAIAVFNSIIRSAIKPFSRSFFQFILNGPYVSCFSLHLVFEEHWPFEFNNVLTLGFRFFLLPRAAILCYCFLVGFCVLIIVGILCAKCQPEYKLKVSVIFWDCSCP